MRGHLFGRRSVLSGLLAVCLLASAVPALGTIPATTGLDSSTHIADDVYYADDAPSFAWDSPSILPRRYGDVDTPSNAMAVAVSGDMAFVADGSSGVQVIDISVPGTPTAAGSLDTSGTAQDVAVSGDTLFVADGSWGLQVVDISQPGTPTLLGSFDTTGVARAVAVAGDVAYVADDSRGLVVIDISDPAVPKLLGDRDLAQSFGVAVAGDVAYVADYGNGLRVIDVSDPSAPTYVTTCDTPGQAQGVAIAGDTAYVADGDEGLQLIDVSDPSAPTLLGAVATASEAYSVAVSGDVAYVADGGSGLQLVDVSDPLVPVRLGTCDTPGWAYGVGIAGSVAYVADANAGLQTIEVAESDSPALLGVSDTPGYPYDVAVSGDIAYVPAVSAGLRIIDVSDPGTPTALGHYPTAGSAWGVAVAGDTAYVADGTGGLQVIDVSEPGTPTLVGTCDAVTDARGVAVSGDTAYVGDWGSGLRVVDVSEPGTPTLIGTYDTPSYSWGVAVAGDIAYVADNASGLQIIDVSQPGTPTLLGTYDTPAYALGVDVAGDIAYVADNASGLQIIDVSQPGTPTLLGTYNTPHYAYEVAISGDAAYVADGGSGLHAIDVSEPGTPTLIGSYDTSGETLAVAVTGDMAFIADGNPGLQIFDIADGPFGYSYSLDAASSTDPDTEIDTVDTSVDLIGAPDGASWFHVRAVGLRREAGDTSHRKIMIDTTEPTTTVQAASGWHRSVDVSLVATDAHSGVADTYYWVNSGSPTSYSSTVTLAINGVYTFNYYSEDNASPPNVEPTRQVTVYIDRRVPESTSDALNKYYGEGTITIEATDAASGVGRIEWAMDGGPAQEYTGPITMDGSIFGYGEHDLTFRAIDNAGNTEGWNNAALNLYSDDTEYTPIAGADRYSTAVEMSQEAFDSAPCVVIATGENWPDALGGAALAAAKGGPILLTAKAALPSSVLAEIRRLGAEDAVILGGPGAVSTAVETALNTELGASNVSRIGGSNRYETADMIAAATVAELGDEYHGGAFVATGLNFPDALAASPIAAAKGHPLYLADPSGLTNATKDAMRAAGVEAAFILGGTSVVPEQVEGQLDAMLDHWNVIRLAGDNRYATAVAVATWGVTHNQMAWDGVALATGENFPDALAGGVLQGLDRSVLLLTSGTSLSSETRACLASKADMIGEVRYLGGPGAVGQVVRDAVAEVLH